MANCSTRIDFSLKQIIKQSRWGEIIVHENFVAQPLNSSNLCNIYQFTTDIVTTNTTMRSNTCSFDNKRCKKKCELRFIANPPPSRIRQSATTKHKNVPHHYEGCLKTICSSASSKFQVSASNNGLLCRACHSLNWSPKVKCAHK